MTTRPTDSIHQVSGVHPGLTKREYFSAIALQGLLTISSNSVSSAESMKELEMAIIEDSDLNKVRWAIHLADELIAELNRTEEESRENWKIFVSHNRLNEG